MVNAIQISAKETNFASNITPEIKIKPPIHSRLPEGKSRLISKLVVSTTSKQRLCFLKLKLRHLKVKSDHSAGPKLAQNMSENKRTNISLSISKPTLLQSFARSKQKISEATRILDKVIHSACLKPSVDEIKATAQAEATRMILMSTITQIEEKE